MGGLPPPTVRIPNRERELAPETSSPPAIASAEPRSMAVRSSPWNRTVVRYLLVAAILLAVITGGIALSQPTSTGSGQSSALELHATLAGALGVLLLVAVVLSAFLGPLRRAALLRGVPTVVLLGFMGAIGQGLAMGSIPVYFVLVQTGLLGLLLVLLALWLGVVGGREDPATPRGGAETVTPGP